MKCSLKPLNHQILVLKDKQKEWDGGGTTPSRSLPLFLALLWQGLLGRDMLCACMKVSVDYCHQGPYVQETLPVLQRCPKELQVPMRPQRIQMLLADSCADGQAMLPGLWIARAERPHALFTPSLPFSCLMLA